MILGEAIGDAGPAIILSFVLAGTRDAFSALAYAELARRSRSRGSAYTYAYATMGDWRRGSIGWDLILRDLGRRRVSRRLGSVLQRPARHLPRRWTTAAVDSLANPPGEEGGKFNLPAVVLVPVVG